MNDLLGKALEDYFAGNYSQDLQTETNISELDEFPLPYLFRSFEEMPALEKKALSLCKGHVLDIGCGAGSHSLHLIKKGFSVTAIDTSPGAVKVAEKRGVNDVRQQDLLHLKGEKFDTLLLLMNGTGIFQKLDQLHTYLSHLKTILTPEGQILIDSSDLKYMYDTTEEGGILVPADRYYGELDFTLYYEGVKSDVFPWLYLDEQIFAEAATFAGLQFEIVQRGVNFDYLARLSF